MKAAAKVLLAAAALTMAPTASNGTEMPAAAVVSAGSYTYLPSTIVVTRGQDLTFVNADVAMHSVTATAFRGDTPVFDSGMVTVGTQATVAGVAELPTNTNGYNFFCQLHPGMRGKLIVMGF